MNVSLPVSVRPKDIQFDTDYDKGGLPDYYCLLKAYMSSPHFMTFISSNDFAAAKIGTEVQHLLAGDEYHAPAWWKPANLKECVESRKTGPGQIWEVIHGIDSQGESVCYMRFIDW